MINLHIDVMKLARMARDKGKKQLANLLMEYEKDAVKKIPYLLELEEKRGEVLKIAVNSCDPNNINNVLSILFKQEKSDQDFS